jgi:hypothetical protein
LATQIQEAFDRLLPSTPNLTNFKQYGPGELIEFRVGNVGVTLNPDDGSIALLRDISTNTSILGNGGVAGALKYQTFSAKQYESFMLNYNYLGLPCLLPLTVSGPLFPTDDLDDFDKVGIGKYDAEDRVESPHLISVYYNMATATLWVQTAFDQDLHTLAGAPAEAWIGMQPYRGSALNVTVLLVNKTATRLPEAIFLQMVPIGNSWTMSKLGEAVDPLAVVTGGGKTMHVVDSVTASWPDRTFNVASPQAGLVRWGKIGALPVPTDLNPDVSLGASFVLFDNTWNTNYIMWYPYNAGEQNIRYDFIVNVTLS